MYLSYSGYKAASCLFQYWHVYINRTKLDIEDDRLNSIFGTSIGKVFETFYNQKMWRLGHQGARQALIDLAPSIVAQTLAEEQTARKGRQAGSILWLSKERPNAKYACAEDIVKDVQLYTHKGVDTIRKNVLVGQDCKAELKLDSTINGHRIAGRADFVLKLLSGDLVIIDGKGTEYKSYLDVDQLTWYSMLYQVMYGTLPDKTAFLLWRKDPTDSLIWHPVTQKTVDELRASIFRVIQDIEGRVPFAPEGSSFEKALENFPPTSSEKKCRFCNLAKAGVCQEGVQFLKGPEDKL